MNIMKRWFELNFGTQRKHRNKKFNLLIIGAQKCGTTSLHYALNQHPQIYMTQPIKEPGYFLPFKTMQAYYKSKNIILKNEQHFFEHHLLKGYNGETYFGESSTFYTTKQWGTLALAKKIKAYNPQMKFIYLVRNRVDRIISHYYHEKAKQANLEFEYFLNTNKEAFEISMYYKRLLPFIEVFGLKNIQTIYFNELINNTENVVKKIHTFLDMPILEELTNLVKKNATTLNILEQNKLFKVQILHHPKYESLILDDQLFMHIAKTKVAGDRRLV